MWSWIRQWQPTPVLLPGKSHGQRSLWAAVHGVAKSQTQPSDFSFTFHLHALEKEMAPHSSVLAWRTPGTPEPGGLLSMGLHRVGHDWSDLAAAACDPKLWCKTIDIYFKPEWKPYWVEYFWSHVLLFHHFKYIAPLSFGLQSFYLKVS